MAWTAPRTWTTGEIVTAAHLNEQVRDNATHLKDTLTSCTFAGAPTRALSTDYQNGSSIRFVFVECRGTSGAADQTLTAVATIGVSANPTTVAAQHGETADNGQDADTLVGFFVPPNYYYKVTVSESANMGAGAIIEWNEWDLH